MKRKEQPSSPKTTQPPHEEIDRSKVTMRELLEMSDVGLQPMSKKVAGERTQQEIINTSSSSSSSSSSMPTTTSTRASGPKFHLTADGKLEVDQESLTINAGLSVREMAVAGRGGTTGGAYQRKPRTKRCDRWTHSETLKFYQALRTFGTDFTLIAGALAKEGRDRAQVKAKYKREERYHPQLLDFALSNSLPLTEEKLREAGIVFDKPATTTDGGDSAPAAVVEVNQEKETLAPVEGISKDKQPTTTTTTTTEKPVEDEGEDRWEEDL